VQSRLTWLVGALAAAIERRGPAWSTGTLTSADIARLLELLRCEFPEVLDGDPALTRLQGIFGLTDLDTDLLAIAAAADIDARVATLLGALAGIDAPSRPTLGVALELAALRCAFDSSAVARGPG
jgi:hypothetical protein